MFLIPGIPGGTYRRAVEQVNKVTDRVSKCTGECIDVPCADGDSSVCEQSLEHRF